MPLNSFKSTSVRLIVIFFVPLILYTPLILLSQTPRDSETRKEAKREWGKTVEEQALSIRAQKAIYAPEERIILNVTHKNVGEKGLMIVQNGGDLTNYEVDVVFEDRKVIPKTLFGQKVEFNGDLTYRSLDTLQPREEVSRSIPLSRYFDFGLGGKYAIMQLCNYAMVVTSGSL